MAKIERYDGNLIPFANNATGGNRTVFGDVAQSDSLDSNLNVDFFVGWESTTDALTPPSKQDFNALGYTSTALASYLYQMGVSEWNTNQDYYEYSRAMGSDGLIYISQNGTNLIPNIGNDPVSDLVNWKWEGINFVDKTSAQTIAGVKTFLSSPIVPTPTTGTQVANKDYVDANVEADWVANDSRAKTALNASGTAPIYACRAWVNFNGTGTVAIRASGNVSSITDNGTGNYTVNFITALQDNDYEVAVNAKSTGSNRNIVGNLGGTSEADLTTTSFPVITMGTTNNALVDSSTVTASVRR